MIGRFVILSAPTTSGQRRGTSQTSDDDGAECGYRGKYNKREMNRSPILKKNIYLHLLLIFCGEEGRGQWKIFIQEKKKIPCGFVDY